MIFVSLSAHSLFSSAINPWARLIVVVLVCLNLSITSAAPLPDMGSSAGALMTLEDERQLGKEFMRSVRYQLKLIEDPILDEYIQNLGQRLASHLDHVDHHYTFFIVDDDTINAFAGPGGYIGVHSGLIHAAKTEDELASVMAHEIAHVSQRHLVRSFEQQSNLAIPAMAAIFAAILLGKSDADVSEALIASTMAGSIQSRLNFSRSHEKEADNVGIELMAKSDYDPRYMAVFFETLLAKNRYTEANLPEFILTHPLTASRVAEAKNRAESYRKPSHHEFSIAFGLMKTRLRALQIGDQPRKQNVAIQTSDDSSVIGRYRRTTQLMQMGKFDAAQKILSQLRKDDDERILYIITAAEIESAAGRHDRAVHELQNALRNFPANRPLTEMYAKELLAQGRAADALSVLQAHINRGYQNEVIFKLYAQSAKQAGQLSKAYEALADYHLLRGELHTALEHLERALEISKGDTLRTLELASRVEKLKQYVLKAQEKERSEN